MFSPINGSEFLDQNLAAIPMAGVERPMPDQGGGCEEILVLE